MSDRLHAEWLNEHIGCDIPAVVSCCSNHSIKPWLHPVLILAVVLVSTVSSYRPIACCTYVSTCFFNGSIRVYSTINHCYSINRFYQLLCVFIPTLSGVINKLTYGNNSSLPSRSLPSKQRPPECSSRSIQLKFMSGCSPRPDRTCFAL